MHALGQYEAGQALLARSLTEFRGADFAWALLLAWSEVPSESFKPIGDEPGHTLRALEPIFGVHRSPLAGTPREDLESFLAAVAHAERPYHALNRALAGAESFEELVFNIQHFVRSDPPPYSRTLAEKELRLLRRRRAEYERVIASIHANSPPDVVRAAAHALHSPLLGKLALRVLARRSERADK